MKTNFIGFYLDDDDLNKLRKLSERYENNNSMTLRTILRETFDQQENKSELGAAE
jgi:hypothetical protein